MRKETLKKNGLSFSSNKTNFFIFKLNFTFHFQDKQSVNFNSLIVDEEDV